MQSRAQAVWEGDLMSGKGRVSSRTSGVLRDAAVLLSSVAGIGCLCSLAWSRGSLV